VGRSASTIAALLLSAAASLTVPGAGTAATDEPACKDADLRVDSTAKVSRARAALKCLIDADRRARGLPALRTDRRLQQVAQTQARLLLDPDRPLEGRRSTLQARIRATGYAKKFLSAEVLGRSIGRAMTASRRLEGWRDDPATRAILRAGRFTDVGIGVSTGRGHATFVVVLAAKTTAAKRR
jgi:uncharacterized protein YkwD